jgi:hypothetical protein
MKTSTLAIFAIVTLLAIAFVIYFGERGPQWATNQTKQAQPSLEIVP